MNTNDMISNIVSLPEKFESIGDISIYSLLKEMGYFEIYDQINEADILDRLIKNPEYINQWLNWSEDKRSSSGWYFKKNENDNYIVGYFSIKEDHKIMEYSNIKEACASFIKREIEEIRKS